MREKNINGTVHIAEPDPEQLEEAEAKQYEDWAEKNLEKPQRDLEAKSFEQRATEAIESITGTLADIRARIEFIANCVRIADDGTHFFQMEN